MTQESFNSNLPETACPSLEELASVVDEAEEHLAQCARCRARVAALGETTECGTFDLPSTLGANKPVRNPPRRIRDDSRLEFGALCSIASDKRSGERLIVVVIGGRPIKDALADGPVTVAPISVETEYASGWDVLVDASDLDLGYDCMVEMWNHVQIARVQFDEVFGRVHASALRRIELVWQSVRRGDGSAPADSGTGPRIGSLLDPRIAFQSAEIERARSFSTQHVEQVRELAGSLVTLLRERAVAASHTDEPPAGSSEAEVLTEVRGRGFITPPDGRALGRVIRLLGVDVAPGTPGGTALEEEASAWLENERPEPALLAARASTMGRVRDAVGRILPRLGGSDRVAAELADYVETVRQAAAVPLGRDG